MTLKGWWPLHDENATDYSGNQNHGTLNGGPTTGVAGRGGLQATSFDGADDYIYLPNISIGSAITYSIWLKPTNLGAGDQVYWVDDSGNGIRFFGHVNKNGGDKAVVDVNLDSSFRSFTSSTALTNEEWYHVVWTHDGDANEQYLYVNGSQEDSGTYDALTGTGSGTPRIGSSKGSNYFTGVVWSPRLYNRALSDAEIRTLHEGGSADLAHPPTDGVARYALDGDATDSWGSNDGTTNGGVSWSSDAIRGQSGDFDGTEDYINGGDVGDPNTVYTISYWVKQTSTTNPIYSLEYANAVNTGNYPPYIFRFEHNNVSNGSIEFGARDGSDNVTELTLTESAQDEWVHVCGIRDGTNLYGYLNGALVATGTLPNATNKYDGSGEFLIGRRGNGEYFDGRIDDVRIYDYAFSPSEVHELYQWGTRGKDMRKHLINRRQK